MESGKEEPSYLVGIDVGGTFTDLIVMGEFGVDLVKVPSVPDDLVGSVLGGLDHLAERHGLTVEGLLGESKPPRARHDDCRQRSDRTQGGAERFHNDQGIQGYPGYAPHVSREHVRHEGAGARTPGYS